MTPLRRSATSMSALVLTVALTACGGGDAPDAAQQPSTGESTSSAAASPSEASPSVAAATGPEIGFDGFLDLRAPKGFKVYTDGESLVSASDNNPTYGPSSVVMSKGIAQVSLDKTAAIALRTGLPSTERGQRLDDVQVDGTPAFVVRGTGKETVTYIVGAQRGSDQVTLLATFRTILTAAQREEQMASMLASWKWL